MVQTFQHICIRFGIKNFGLYTELWDRVFGTLKQDSKYYCKDREA